MLQFGLRLGEHPRQVITTTPRPTLLLKRLLVDPRSAVTTVHKLRQRWIAAALACERTLGRSAQERKTGR
jgi:hypothetical protein